MSARHKGLIVSEKKLLQARGITHSYRDRGGAQKITVLRGISFELERGEVLGIVGSSGAGKSTLCRIILGLETPDDGSILFDGSPLPNASFRQPKKQRGRIQAVFQDPRSSLNPSLSVKSIIAEPLLAQHPALHNIDDQRIGKVLETVRLPSSIRHRKSGQLSGGERQRVAIARALVTDPELIVLDEPVSSLDAIIRREVLSLLSDLKRRLGLSMILVSHDVRSINALTDRTIVLHGGLIVEEGLTADLLRRPAHPFTKTLIAAVPKRVAPSGR